jgi:hypothetical protein
MWWQTRALDTALLRVGFIADMVAGRANAPTTHWLMSLAPPFLSRAANVLGKQHSAAPT